MTSTPGEALWPAPVAAGPVRATVSVPGSKSVTNRALVLSALAASPSRLARPLRSRDTELMAAGLCAMGTDVVAAGDAWVVTPAALRGPATVDVGLAGTVMRFLPALATLADGAVTFDGDPRARERPLAALLGALRDLGARVDDGGRAALPLTVTGTGGLRGGEVRVDASASSQIVSALLLTAPRWEAGVRVVHIGDRPVPNAPHLAMTVSMLRDRQVRVDDAEPGGWQVQPGPVAGRDEVIEPDLSSAAPFLAAAVVTGGEVRVPNWPERSSQPGADLPRLLEAFGASSHRENGSLVVRGGGRLTGADLDLRDAGELTPVLTAVAVLAETPSRFTGIGYLRGHETDRLAALAHELGGLGARVNEEPDGLRIEPRPMVGGLFRTYADHRLAMAAAVLALVVPGVLVQDVETTAKTFPGFADAWLSMLSGGAP
ncbi:MAG: 3-phosphoshikimate 1-carboxyvinyltransferase [Frankiaceae bacterium]|nr:3-phosphoshikimate 1-carboxyvinyltransferase [Frankiaceae bacterium]